MAQLEVSRLLADCKSIVPAMDLLLQSEEEPIVFQACMMAMRHINENWVRYEELGRFYTREALQNRLLSGAPICTSRLIDLIVAVAIKDWPEAWPDCLSGFIGTIYSSGAVARLSMATIPSLLSTVSAVRTLTSGRRAQLLGLLKRAANEMLVATEWAATTYYLEAVAEAMAGLFAALSVVSPAALLGHPGLVEFLMARFVGESLTSGDACAALSNAYGNPQIAGDEAVCALLRHCGAWESKAEYPPPLMSFPESMVRIHEQRLLELASNDDESFVALSAIVSFLLRTFDPMDEEAWSLFESLFLRAAQGPDGNRFAVLAPGAKLALLIPSARGIQAEKLDERVVRIRAARTTWYALSAADRAAHADFVADMGVSSQALLAIGMSLPAMPRRMEVGLLTQILPRAFRMARSRPDQVFFGGFDVRSSECSSLSASSDWNVRCLRGCYPELPLW
jgi:hypothetical protein